MNKPLRHHTAGRVTCKFLNSPCAFASALVDLSNFGPVRCTAREEDSEPLAQQRPREQQSQRALWQLLGETALFLQALYDGAE